ncbi:glycosyltransferase [Sporosalibacterium faouarense]|uniref:glycosyltransferase n=1 Tax=Sporosalibacterium faouarense TaxID=516123 RepID=UPI00141C6B4F|nr:glycosyltransferase [Sporosalibacterium faouarense]MTI48179.1 phospho-N-acetylmuramoyl-pentapeptide-transferase [Bacillota bacterium]
MKYIIVIAFLSSIIVSYIVIPYVYSMLMNQNCTEKNYKSQNIPIGMGLVFVISQTIICLSISIFYNNYRMLTLVYLIIVLLIAFISLLDDLIGNKNIKGLRGHFKSLINGTLTTGGLKAIMGIFSALIASLIISVSLLDIVINLLVISLFTNLINLFDLRPGRAIKVFFILTLILLITSQLSTMNFILFSAIGTMLVYFPYDIKAKSMMGDIGSNSLGITLGFYCGVSNPIKIKLVYLAILVLLHITAEIVSFTKIINKNRMLNYFDNLGR